MNGQFAKGQPAWNRKVGHIFACGTCKKEVRVKEAEAFRKYCSRSCAHAAQVGKPSHMAGKSTSEETKKKQRAAKLGIRGEAHWNWRNGNRSERKKAMARDEYVQWRAAVFRRDDYTCQFCGERGRQLHADHIKPWATFPDLRYELSNGRTLCVPCHWKTETFPTRLIPKQHRCPTVSRSIDASR